MARSEIGPSVTVLKDNLIEEILSQPRLETAWKWLCDSRKHFPSDADVWHLIFHREQLLPEIMTTLRGGRYRLSPMEVVTKGNGEEIALWSAADALVLKLLTLTLQEHLPLHRSCTHLRGHGGHKYAVHQTHNWIAGGAYPFVCKTDIRGYYASIDKLQLLELLARQINCPITMELLSQFLYYSVEKGGNFHTPRRGIPRSCPLSPLLAGFHLYQLDRDLSQRRGVRYLRFMDDLLILAQTRWQLKRAVATMNRWFEQARLQQHPDKTFIGRISRGFDWLGYRYARCGIIRVASKTLNNHLDRIRRLYELSIANGASSVQAEVIVAVYRERWVRWMNGGLSTCALPTKPGSVPGIPIPH